MHKLLIDPNNYIKKDLIGEGTFGRSYLLNCKDDLFVGKVFKKQNESLDDLKSLFREIDFQSKAKCVDVLKLIGFNEKDFNGENYPIIITQYMKNGSIKNHLKTLTKPQRYIIILGIAYGMKELHSKEIYHLNLKPSNILLDENFYPRISDFRGSEIDKLNDYIEINRDAFPYMAPEVAKGNNYTLKADVYSFALIAYEILTGISVGSLLTDNSKLMRPDLSIITDKSIQTFFMKCWSANPDDRLSFEEIIEEFSTERYREYMDAKYEDLEKYYTYKYKVRADEDEDAEAMNCYACMLEQGDHPDITEVVKYYKNAIEHGSVKALFNFARMNFFGDGIPVNKEEAVRLYELAVDKGNAYAMNNLAYMLYIGDGVPLNIERSIFLFKMGVLKGNPPAIHNLAYFYRSGFGVPMNKQEAINILKGGIAKNNPQSMYDYAEMLRFGEGIPVNLLEAIKLYKMAIELDYTDAMCDYADILRSGEGGILVDIDKAKELLQLASKKGNKRAINKLIDMGKEGQIAPNEIIKGPTFEVINLDVVKFYDGVPIKKPQRFLYKSIQNHK